MTVEGVESGAVDCRRRPGSPKPASLTWLELAGSKMLIWSLGMDTPSRGQECGLGCEPWRCGCAPCCGGGSRQGRVLKRHGGGLSSTRPCLATEAADA